MNILGQGLFQFYFCCCDKNTLTKSHLGRKGLFQCTIMGYSQSIIDRKAIITGTYTNQLYHTHSQEQRKINVHVLSCLCSASFLQIPFLQIPFLQMPYVQFRMSCSSFTSVARMKNKKYCNKKLLRDKGVSCLGTDTTRSRLGLFYQLTQLRQLSPGEAKLRKYF